MKQVKIGRYPGLCISDFNHLPVFTVVYRTKSLHLQWRDRVGFSQNFPFKHESVFSCTYPLLERNVTSVDGIETDFNIFF